MRITLGGEGRSDLEGNLDVRSTTVFRDILDDRIVVPLWTIQVVSVLFTVALTIWMTLANDIEILTDSQVWARFMATILLVPLVLLPLLVESRLYIRRVLSATTYLRLQSIKIVLWSLLLYIILVTVSGWGEEGIRIFRGAAEKLM